MEKKKKIIVEYSSNNSGVRWWLKDKDWYALEKAGWKVVWSDEEVIYQKGTHVIDNQGFPMTKKKEGEEKRWLGALARDAYFKCSDPSEAIRSFEKVTGKNASDEGCNCCGAPHSFSWDGGYCSGEDCLGYLYDNPPTSLREAAEILSTRK